MQLYSSLLAQRAWGVAHPKPATSEPMPLRVSSVDEMGTDESHCQSGERRSHGGERHVY